MKTFKKYKIGIGFGSINPIHYGHIWLFQKAKEMCEVFVVGLDTDEFLTKVKKKEMMQDYETRKKLVEELRCVDFVVPQSTETDKNYWVKNLKCDAIFVGDDHINAGWEGEKVATENGAEVVFLPHTAEIHSEQIRAIINASKHDKELKKKKEVKPLLKKLKSLIEKKK